MSKNSKPSLEELIILISFSSLGQHRYNGVNQDHKGFPTTKRPLSTPDLSKHYESC